MLSYKEFSEFQARMNAMKEIIKLNDPEKYMELSRKDALWAPEVKAIKYSNWVNSNYEANPNDPVSLR